MTPLPATTTDRARRLELWDDLEAAGGSRLAALPDDAYWDTRLDQRLEEAWDLSLSLSREADVWSSVDETHVLRLDYSDSKALEFRIAEIEERVGEDGARTASLTALSPLDDLEVRDGLLRRIEANGRLRYEFTVLGITPADHVNLILGGPSAYASGAPSHFSAGTIEPTDPVDVVYDSDTPLSALRQLAGNVEGGAEIQLRRDGAAGYLVDLLLEVGSSASEPYVSLGRNLNAFDRRRSTDEQGTRVIPFGGGGGEERRATMARAAWVVASVSGSDVTFESDLMNEDGQLVGRYVEKENGALTEVTASVSPDTVTVADASNIAAGDLLRFRENSAGDQLTYLESPSAVSRYGVIQRQIDRGDVPPVDNLAPNAFLAAWTSGTPDDWSVVGSPPVAQNNNEEFTRKGGASARVGDGTTKAAEGEGLQTVAVDVAPTAEEPYFTGQISVWVVSGSVEVLLIDETNGVTFPPSGSEQRAVTDETGRWVENLAVAGYEAPGASSMRLQVVAAEDGTEFYLDAGQLTNTPSGRRTFYDGRASNRLWQAALDELATNAEPEVRYALTVSDLTALDDATWPGEELHLGGTVRLRVPDLGVDVRRRIQRIARDPFRPAEVNALEVEKRREALSRRLAARRRRRRPGEEERPTDLSRPEDVTGFAGFYSDRVVLAWDQSRGAARYEIRAQGSGTSAQERWENGTVWARPAGTDFTKTDPEAGSLDLTIKAVGPQGRYSSVAAELTVNQLGQLVEEETEETESQGTVRVTPIWGDSSRTFTIEFWGRDANATFASSADQTDTGVAHGGTRSFTYALPEEHGAAVKYRVTDEATGIAIVEQTVKFDQNKVPNHSGHTLVRIDGDVYLLHSGDADWASLKYAKNAGASPAEPTRTDVQNGVTVGGRTGRTLIHSGLSKGEEIEVGVLGYSQSSAGGLESAEVWRDSVKRPGAQDAVDVKPSAHVEIADSTFARKAGGETERTFTLRLKGIAGPESGTPSLEGRWRLVRADGTVSGWFDEWTATPFTFTPAYATREPYKMVQVQVRDAGAPGSPESDIVPFAGGRPIPEGMTPPEDPDGGGRIDDRQQTYGGDFPAGGAPTGAKAELDARTGAGGNLPTDYVHAERRTPDGVTPIVAADGALKSGLYRPSDSAALENIISKLKSTGKGEASLTIDGFPALRGAEVGGAQDQESVSFGNGYSGPPDVTFFPQRGLSYDLANNDVDLRQELVAKSLSKDGFDMKAKIVTGTQFTAIDDGFGEDPGSQSTSSEDLDRTMSSDGAVSYSNLEDADLPSVTYTVCYDVDTRDMDPDVLVTVHMEVNDGADSTNWTEVASQAYDAGSIWNDEKLSADAALDANYDIRLRITYGPTVPSSTDLATITAHAETSSPPGVEYNRDDGTTTINMTPQTADEIAYLARASS